MSGTDERPLRALVLAAGLGTRLGALSDERPKPLLPVCDVPLIRYAVALLAGHGVTEIAVNLHHKGELIERELGTGADLGVTITYSREAVILGTGGGIVQLADFLTDGGARDFYVVNGKLVVDADLHALRARHERTHAVATMLLKEDADAQRWGAIELARDGRVLRIIGKGGKGPSAAPAARTCMFTGIHVLSPRLIERLPKAGESDSIRQAYLPALLDGERIEGVVLDGYFHEHSTPARYLEGNLNCLYGRARLHYPPGPFTGVDASAIVDASAQLIEPLRIGARARIGAGATVGPGVVIGHDAEVATGARVERAVLWPGARIEGAHADVIVSAAGAIPARP
jgi:NDP-sugar pyrophosphorylase family protein